MAKSKRLTQETYKPLRIEVPDFDDPKATQWAKKLEKQINDVLIRILQQNQDKLLAVLQLGTTGINTATVSAEELIISGGTHDWTMTASGDRLTLKYNDETVVGWNGA